MGRKSGVVAAYFRLYRRRLQSHGDVVASGVGGMGGR